MASVLQSTEKLEQLEAILLLDSLARIHHLDDDLVPLISGSINVLKAMCFLKLAGVTVARTSLRILRLIAVFAVMSLDQLLARVLASDELARDRDASILPGEFKSIGLKIDEHLLDSLFIRVNH